MNVSPAAFADLRVVGLTAETALASPLSLGAPAFYWAEPSRGIEVCAFGEAERREAESPEEARALLARLTGPTTVSWLPSGRAPAPPLPWVGAHAFDVSRPSGASWDGFAPVRFVLPALLVHRERGRQHVTAMAPRGTRAALERIVDDVRRRLDDAVRVEGPAGEGARITAVPTPRARWTALVGRALEAIARGELDKVVLARAIDVTAPEAIDARALLASLSARFPSCTSYLVAGDGAGAFVGATPELLCRIEGRKIAAEALAGTARPEEAAALGARAKDLREHGWVVEHLLSALRPLASVAPPGPKTLRALANVVHLATPIEGRLEPGVTAGDVLAALHPTPAVGGAPRAPALRFIAEHEGLERGLYAGLVGMLGPDRAELSVALRCALVRGRSARVFAGAGIVAGSSPDDEWAETGLKSRALLDALGADP